LDPRYTFGVLIPNGAHCADPGAYVAALARRAISEGATFLRAHARGFALRDGQLSAVHCGEREIACDAAVIAAGIHSAPLAQQCGDRVPLASERGYHVVLHDTQLPMPMPIMPADGKMANTPTRQGLRLAGQVELARMQDPPNWNRADILLAHARKAYPALRDLNNVGTITRWMGHRPSTPDGLPVIGPALGCADVVYAYGHGHVGLAAAPATAELVADWFAARTTTFDPEPYLAERFR
jgi:D-amino-acid dehydrogenase